jgi:penicillin amidase
MGMILRWLTRLIAAVLVAAALAALAFWLFLKGSLAQLDGQATGQGLSSLVAVTRDANGVPNITGQNPVDVAFALGFVHAQERFFQMDLLRRLPAGELAELFGPKALAADRQHRFHRLRARAELALKNAPAEEQQRLERYADGVNAGLKALKTRPWEYLVTLSRPRPWTPADSLLVVWAMYWDLQGNLEPREWSRGWLKEHVSPEQLAFLLPDSTAFDAPLDGPSPNPVLTVPATAPDWWSRPVEQKTGSLPPDNIVGSNNWAVAGSRTADGHGILHNDMHLGINLPPIWYRAQLTFHDEQNAIRSVVGVTLPGVPGVVVGSNGHVAWGFTNSYGDWLDLVRLDQDAAHPGQVKVGEDWVSPATYDETILVNGGPPEKLIIHETTLGPIREVDGQAYAVHWVADGPDAVNMALLQLATAPTVEAALAIGDRSGMPGQNMVAADDAGHIGWTITGPMPDRAQPGAESSFPLEPGQEAQGWTQLLPPERHPRVIDPAGGQLQTANSRQLMGPEAKIIGDGGFDLGARTRQIRDDLKDLGNGVDVKAVYGVVLDDRALFMEGWRARALAVLDEQAVGGYPQRSEFKRLLNESWDGHAGVNSVGYRLTRGFYFALYDECFATLNEALGKLDRGASYRRATTRWPAVVEALLKQQPAAWLPPGRKDWREVQLAAIDKTIASLTENGATLAQASWGKRNTARIMHPFAKLVPALEPVLSAPADMLPGDEQMPRVAGPDFGSSERLTVAPGKEDEGVFNMPGGESAHPLSPFFLAGHEDWVQAKPTPLLPGAAKYGLVLTPG